MSGESLIMSMHTVCCVTDIAGPALAWVKSLVISLLVWNSWYRVRLRAVALGRVNTG